MLEPPAQAAAVVAAVLAGRNLNDVLSEVWRRETNLNPRARGAIQDLSFGSLRYLPRLEFLLHALVPRPLQHEGVHCLLLVGLYQLNYSKTRPYAIVDQAVESARAMGAAWAANLVNGVLRNFLRNQADLLAQAETQEPARYSHPQWWIDQLRQDYPAQWTDILDNNNSRPPMTLRINQRRVSVEQYMQLLREAELEAEALEHGAIVLKKPVPVEKLPRFAQGWVSVQDAGAQHAAPLLDLAAGQRVLDACAAPGGKAAHILEFADVSLWAVDKDAARLQSVKDNFRRLDLEAQFIAGDAARPEDWWEGQTFDRILADVPCSASGVVRRHPDIKYLRRPSDIAQFAATQRIMLGSLWRLLAPGGKLLYATCSLFHEENQDVIADFLKHENNAQQLPLPDSARMLLPSLQHDGFFYALLQKPV